MNIPFPLVYDGKKYGADEFFNSFVCSECGAGLTPSEKGIVCFFDKEHSGIKLREKEKMDKLPVKLDEVTTLTGIKIVDAILKMNERLDDAAYKEYNPTKAYALTDISPAYLLEKLNEIFGPPGLGWRYEFDADSVECNGAAGSFTASVIGFRMYYTLVWDGESHEIGPILTTGSSSNSKKEYALKGAITNALGTAAYRGLNWQLEVYKGRRTHLGDTEDTPKVSDEPALNFLDAASLHLKLDKTKEIAISDSAFAPVAQYQLIKSLDETAAISSLPDLVTQPVSDAIRANLIKLMTIAECEVQFSEDLFDKPMAELTVGEFRMFWTSLAMIAGGDKREEVTKRMKALHGG